MDIDILIEEIDLVITSLTSNTDTYLAAVFDDSRMDPLYARWEFHADFLEGWRYWDFWIPFCRIEKVIGHSLSEEARSKIMIELSTNPFLYSILKRQHYVAGPCLVIRHLILSPHDPSISKEDRSKVTSATRDRYGWAGPGSVPIHVALKRDEICPIHMKLKLNVPFDSKE